MDGTSPRVSWSPLDKLTHRFAANVDALATRYPELAQNLRVWVPRQNYYLFPGPEDILIGAGNGSSITPLPHTLPPSTATNIMRQMFPTAKCTQPVLIVGEDLGWLWNGLYSLPCDTPAAPGHHPALFFLMRDIELLWIILHIHDWRNLLADSRVRLFTGDNAMSDFRQSLVAETAIPWPRLSVRVDPALWNGSPTLDEILIDATAKSNQLFLELLARFRVAYANRTPDSIVAQLTSGRPLKILGITSRFTTFLQYSMRDWLNAFERLGHQTHLVIENHDHETCNALGIASACAQFVPDLVVIIDHYRAELKGIPEQIPMVMWVQDALPNIYRREAGAAQGRLDYTIGYGRCELVTRNDYPGSRFMPAMVGVNPEHFAADALEEGDIAPFRCDVSYVTHATMPAERIIAEEIARNGSPEVKRLLDAVFDRLRAVYEAGGSISAGEAIHQLILDTVRDLRMSADIPPLLDLFSRRVNNALFRHQPIRWIAEMGVDLRLYGQGWENHPEFKRFARGVADNRRQLPAIYLGSKINLQVTPSGAVHQRLLDGLAAGGFFLCRSTATDDLESLRRDIWQWCRQNHVSDGADMLRKRDQSLDRLFKRYVELDTVDPSSNPGYYFTAFEECAMSGFTRTVNTLFSEHERVTFSTREQLVERVKRFLSAPEERREIARSMRQRVLATHTYTAITERMLDFITADLKTASIASKRAA
jgi:hypothetical protein